MKRNGLDVQLAGCDWNYAQERVDGAWRVICQLQQLDNRRARLLWLFESEKEGCWCPPKHLPSTDGN